MKPNSQPQESKNQSMANPEFIAQQLRRPSGDFAMEVGQKMDHVNEPLYSLTLDVMEPQEGDKILEIGFGTGKYFNKLFNRADGLQLSGIDFSEAMVEAAKDYNRDAIYSGKLKIQQGSSEAIPFSDHSFDKVFCNMVIYFWDHPEVHLKEIQRVLKPGGTFLTGMRTRESMLAFPFVEYGFNLYSTEEWEEILNQNGFLHKRTEKSWDPEIEVDGSKLHLESCCTVAENS